MTARAWDNKWDLGSVPQASRASWGQTGAPAPLVVALLYPSACLNVVARTAVREAQAVAARVRFIQVHHDSEVREEEDEFTFAAAVRALRDSPRLPVTFEAVDVHGGSNELVTPQKRTGNTGAGGPLDEVEPQTLAQLVVSSSKDALVLVVGTAGEREREVLSYAQRHAACDVLAVHEAPPPGGPAPSTHASSCTAPAPWPQRDTLAS